MKSYQYLVLIILLFTSPMVRGNDIELIKQNLRDFYILEAASDDEVKVLLDGMDTDYSFRDIDYTMHRRSNWQPREHLKRLIALATAYENAKSRYYQADEMATSLVGGLNYWSNHLFYSDNWWQQEIGIPQSLGPSLIICESIIPDSTMSKCLKIMDKSRIYMTGQNKIWLSGNVLMRELARGNTSMIDTAAQTIKSVMVPSKPYEEGIQPDYSFHQHGPQPQFGNYGLHFAEDIIKWMYIFKQTAIAFPPEKVDLMRKLMFEGQQKVVYKGKYEILATGRQIFPEKVNGKTYRGPMAKAKLYNNLEKIFNALDTHNNPNSAPKEYIHYRNSDYSLYRSDAFFSAVRMSSQRVIGAEAGNGENQLGYYLGDGTQLIYRRGDEYHEIYPVWNWKKLPGTTTVQDSAKIPELTWEGYRNGSHFTGGLKGQGVGISAFKYRRDSLAANKSYFFTGNQYYALGSAISSTRNFDVVTSINQCYRKGDVVTIKQEDGISAVWHDSIAYVSLCPQQLKVRQEVQSGSWKKVLTWHSDSLISRDIFSIEVNHGPLPKQEKYAYAGIVGIAKNELIKTMETELAEVIAHNDKVHALSLDQGKTIAICAFEACELMIGAKEKLIIKSPCLLSLRKQNKAWSIDAVDPTQKLSVLSFEISGQYHLEGSSRTKAKKGRSSFNIYPPSHNNDKGKKTSITLLAN